MKRHSIFQLNIVLYSCLFLLLTPISNNAVYANTDKVTPSVNTTINSILGALADMTLDEAKKIINLKFTRDFREQVCGLHPYTTEIIRENITKEEKSKDIRFLFPGTCDYVKKKIERNIFSSELMDEFRKDMVLNGVMLIKNRNIPKIIENRKNLSKNPSIFSKELLARNIIYLSWTKLPVKEAILQSLYENIEFKNYGLILERALNVEEKLKGIDSIVKNSLHISFTGTHLKLNYDRLIESNGEYTIKPSNEIDINISDIVNKLKNKDDKNKAKTLSLLFRIATATNKESKQLYERKLIEDLVVSNIGDCNATCIKSINYLINNKPKEIFKVLDEVFLNDKMATSHNEADVDNTNKKYYKAITTLNSLSELSNVEDRDTARAILDKYLADSNTRTSTYWDLTYTLGTLLGVASGSAKCEKCTNSNRSITPNLYMPFGLFITQGTWGAQLHLFDLGQYTSTNEDQTKEDSFNYKDAVAPGIAIFKRLRKYPISNGFDYTFIPARDSSTVSEHQIRYFIAMDLQLFKLN